MHAKGKKMGMPASMTRTPIETPLDNGPWQIWCKYDYNEELNYQGNTTSYGMTFPTKSQTSIARAAELAFSLFVTFLLSSTNQQQH